MIEDFCEKIMCAVMGLVENNISTISVIALLFALSLMCCPCIAVALDIVMGSR